MGRYGIIAAFAKEAYEPEQLCGAVMRFALDNEDLGLGAYMDILKKNGFHAGGRSVFDGDVSNVDGQCILALLVAAVRTERFGGEPFCEYIRCGAVDRWLCRLAELEA